MRKLSKKEQDKRGCAYCRYVFTVRKGTAKYRSCPAKPCPFHELDGFDSYAEYLKANNLDISMKKILMMIGSLKEEDL